jgi:hypothetical protein
MVAGSWVQAQQTGGAGTNINIPGNASGTCRMAGFSFNNQYFLAYDNGISGYSSTPSLAYGGLISTPTSAGNPPILHFQNPTSIPITGVPTDVNTTHSAAAVVNDAPYLFEFKCKPGKKPSVVNAYYQKYQGSSVPGQPFSTTQTVNSSLSSSLGTLFDVAAAPLGSKMYLFMLTGTGDSPTGITVWSYAGQGSGGPVAESNYTFANSNSPYIQSLDATNVTLESGEQAIIVTTAYVHDGVSQVKAWLFAGNATSPVSLPSFSMANPPYAQIPGTVRLCYGPASGLVAANSCTVFFAAVQHNIFSSDKARIYAGQIGLPTSLAAGTLSQLGGWSQQTNLWQSTRNQFFTQYPYAWTVFPVAVPYGTTTNGYSSVAQYITMFQKGNVSAPFAHPDLMTSSLALEMQLDPSTAATEWDSSVTSTLSDGDAKAAVQSWNLLGIITGIPPLPAGTTVTYRAPILTLAYDKSQGKSVQTSNTTVVTAGVSVDIGFLNSSATYTNAIRQGSTSTQTITLGVNEEYHSNADKNNNTYDAYSDQGYLIVSQPKYFTSNYDVYAYDGQTYLGVSHVTISANGTTLASIPFYLDNPANPYPNNPACIYQSFPVNSNGVAQVTYHLTTDIENWKTSPPILTDVAPFSSFSIPDIAGVDYESSAVKLTSSSTNSFSNATTNKITVGTGVDFFGIGGKGKSSFIMKSQTSVAIATSQTGQIVYPQLQDTQGYSAIKIQPNFNKLANLPNTQPNWMPTIFEGSQPWILSWQVLSYTTTSSSPSGSTGNSGDPSGPHCRR